MTPPPIPPDLLERVERARRALLLVHQAVLQAERVEYEGEHGRIENNSEFLGLALHAPRFAWMRPLLALVVEIDESMAAEGGADEQRLRALVTRARECLRPDEHGDAFQRRYLELLQEAPAVVIAHGQAMELLRGRAMWGQV